jgi:hypothetical protein
MKLTIDIPDKVNCWKCRFISLLSNNIPNKQTGFCHIFEQIVIGNDSYIRPCKPCMEYRRKMKEGV